MSETTASRLLKALMVGLAIGAWHFAKRRPPQVRSAYPNLAGNFAL